MIAFAEGLDSSIAVADDASGDRILAVDGFAATSQGTTTHDLAWMGRLPTPLHPAPEQTLAVSASGRGRPRTACARKYDGARHRRAELRRLLDGPAVHQERTGARRSAGAIHRDGWPMWSRRTNHTYDVVTLEPMPPNFAGVNALYSLEFYRLVEARPRPRWYCRAVAPVPFALARRRHGHSGHVPRVFGDALLWIDPIDYSGVIVGVAGGVDELALAWPGLLRAGTNRDMSAQEIVAAVKLDRLGMERYASFGRLVTDDNQLLAYGAQRRIEIAQSDALMASHSQADHRVRSPLSIRARPPLHGVHQSSARVAAARVPAERAPALAGSRFQRGSSRPPPGCPRPGRSRRGPRCASTSRRRRRAAARSGWAWAGSRHTRRPRSQPRAQAWNVSA